MKVEDMTFEDLAEEAKVDGLVKSSVGKFSDKSTLDDKKSIIVDNILVRD